MNIKKVLNILTNKKLSWYRVGDQPCVNTFYKGYYINLCRYSENGSAVISVNVDYMEDNLSDIVDTHFLIGTDEYKKLRPVYDDALRICEDLIVKLRSSSKDSPRVLVSR